MISGRSVLAIIPARGGSKGVPRKNIRKVGGKPLIAWSIEEARKSQYIDRLILSSEDEEIIEIARRWGCEVPFIRPVELAQDETPGIAPILHALDALPQRYDIVVLLQPTSPLRNTEDIDGCIAHLVAQNATSCVSVTEPDKSPYWMYRFDKNTFLKPLFGEQTYTSRQQLPKVYALNGAVYVAECSWLIHSKGFISHSTVGYIMPKERSLDIDTEHDLRICEILRSISERYSKLPE
jgi:N-acylneuraminate cytidylyltransferase